MNTDPMIKRLVTSYSSWAGEPAAAEHAMGRMTKELYPYDALFSPIAINKLTVKNRIVMAPMGNIDMCEENGRPNAKMLEYFFARAKGGTGLLTTGLVPVSHGLDNTVTEPGKLSYFPRIDRSRTVLSGWRDLAQGVHAYGSRIFIQLTPGLGRVGNPQCLLTTHKFPQSASANPNFYIPQIPCVRISDRKLRRIVKNAGQAAADAKACGIDGVYLHGHEGYLLEQMTNPAFNRRKLGRYRRWENFGIELVETIRRRVGPDYPIMYRIDLSLALNETYGERMNKKPLRKFRNGRTVEETLDYMQQLVQAGVDVFDVDLGCYDNWWLPHPPAGMPAGCYLGLSATVKQYFKANNILSNAGLPVPVVAVGKLGYPDVAERALRDGLCDMVMLGRPLLADPEWPNKVRAGRLEDLCPCIGCHEGCINEFVNGGHPQCAVNPRTGFEDVIPAQAQPAQTAKRIAVIGGGPAGISFALEAADRGHKVELFESGDTLGGRLNPASAPRSKFDLDNYRAYLCRKAEKAGAEGKITLRMNTPASPEALANAGYDAIVCAVGTRDVALRLPGSGEIRCCTATELLCDPALLGQAEKIAVIGGGSVGCETALWLQQELGKQVTVIEQQPYFMDGVCTANRGHLLHSMVQSGVQLLNMASVQALTPDGVQLRRNVSKNVPDPACTWQPVLPKNIHNPLAPKIKEQWETQEIPADMVVFAVGGRPDESFFFTLQELRAAPELYNIGDSFAGGRVLEAVRAGFRLARTI